MRTQHPTQQAQYTTIKSDNECDQFFVNVPAAFKNSIKTHFPSSSLGTKCQIVFNIDTNIVDTIVGDMLFDLVDEFNNNEDVDVEDPVFSSEVDLNVVMHLRLEAVATTKLRVLALFKRIQYEANDDVNDKRNSPIQ